MTARIALRKSLGLRLADLAGAAGVSIPSISLWERGRLNLNRQAVEKIAAAINARICEVPVFESTDELTEVIARNQQSPEEVACNG